jgi:4-hydroxy-tetrahydrodipicolinate synthase
MVKRDERKEWAREKVKGLFYGNITPFTEDLGAIDEHALRANLRHCVKLGASGIGWGGPLAEPDSMTIAERKRGHEILAEEAQRAGVISYAYPATSSFPEVLELAGHANDVGCDLLMLNVPFEWAKTDAMIFDFYKRVAEHAGDIGIMLYDTPHAGYMLPLELMDQICDIPNVCTNKGSGGGVEENLKLLDRLGRRLVISAGTMRDWPAFAEAGFAFPWPTSCHYMVQTPQWQPNLEIFELSARGEYAQARKLVERITPLLDSWSKVYQPFHGRPFGREEHPAAGIKFWLDSIGMKGGAVRPPTQPLSEEERAWMVHDLREHQASGLLKLPAQVAVRAVSEAV